MEKITNVLSALSNEKINALKLLEVVYSKRGKFCDLTFLYPESIDELSADEKLDVLTLLKKELKLSCELRVKYKKSFLNAELIKNEVLSFLKDNHKTISFNLNIHNINCEISPVEVSVVVCASKDVVDYLKSVGLTESLKAFLERNFIANFSVSLCVDESVKIEAYDNLKNTSCFVVPPQKITPRYEVDIYKKLIGGEFMPKPELFKNITSAKDNVILSGVVKSIEKKVYVKAKDKGTENAPQHAYYVVSLLEKDREIPTTIFASSSNESKIEKYLQTGARIVAKGHVKMSLSRLCFYPKDISLCNEIESSNVTEKKFIQKNYMRIKPEKYHSASQENIFVEVKYDDFINNNTYVVYDFETTGLDSLTCEIIEIGACKIKNGEIIETFQTFVKPEHSIPQEITNITTITNKMVECAPGIEIALADFSVFCRDCVLAGYNNIMFDNKFLQISAKKIGVDFSMEQVDVFVMSKKALRQSSYKLCNVVKTLGIVLDGAHRALNDALATAKVMLKLHQI